MSVKTQSEETLKIRSSQGDYDVEMLRDSAELASGLNAGGHQLCLIDEKVAHLYPELEKQFAEISQIHLLPATEDEKTWEGIGRVLSFLQSRNATKHTVILAVGGGIIQDISTFASHVYYRGIKWRFAPTTLLSMSDSCIGAKCGINLGPYKNQLGAFHSPDKVVICPSFLETLSDNDIRSGYGEILKLCLTGSAQDYYQLSSCLSTEGFRNNRINEWILTSLRIKKGIIEEDEYEKNLRYILNYGHTFGHALESLTAHEIPHGLSVAWGCDVVNFLSCKMGLLSKEWFDDIHKLIEQHFAFPLKATVTAEDLINAAQRDKKVLSGMLNLILLTEPGNLKRIPIEFNADLKQWLGEYLKLSNVLRNRN